MVRLGILDPQGPTFNEKARVWELHSHDTKTPPLNPDGSPALRRADAGPETWGWTVQQPGEQPHKLGSDGLPYMAWSSSTRSSQLRQEREQLGPDTLYVKNMTPEQEAAYALHACDATLASQNQASMARKNSGASMQAPFGTDHNAR